MAPLNALSACAFVGFALCGWRLLVTAPAGMRLFAWAVIGPPTAASVFAALYFSARLFGAA